MPEPAYIISAVAVAGLITWILRAAPFVMLAPLRNSALLAYLGECMPVGIMLILAVYTVQDLPLEQVSASAPVVIALAVTVALQLWRGKMTWSIFAGTGVYVALMSFGVF